MTDAMRPTLEQAVLLASIAVHAEEFLSPSGASADAAAIEALLAHPDLRAYLERLDALALLPVKREQS